MLIDQLQHIADRTSIRAVVEALATVASQRSDRAHASHNEPMVAAGVQNVIQKARIRRTRRYFEGREAFMADLVADVAKAIGKATSAGFVPVFRLNGTSDIRWETVAVAGHANIFAMFPDVQFYDYTKLANRKNVPANYALTFSLADGNSVQARVAFQNGMNVAAVFRDKATVAKYEASGFAIDGHFAPVVNGDETDLRFLDPKGHLVALYAKGNARQDTSGFVRD